MYSGYRLSKFDNFVSLGSFLTLHDVKFDRVAFLKGFEALTLDSRVVNENVRSAILADEAVALTVIEPLYFPLKSCHLLSSLISF